MRPSDDQRVPLVIVTDAHISRQHGNSDAFFEMLAALEQGAGDVVFLGDIFDLWIALTRYEDALHHRFLSWCRRQKTRRRVAFIEGNHEFFLARQHADAFTWCTPQAWWRDAEGNLFCHGDRINRFDRRYLAFRKLIKNPIARALIYGLPLGPRLVQHVKEQMKGTNRAFRKSLPQEQIRQFAENRFREGAVRIFLGHFHQAFHYRPARGRDLYTLPDWHSEGWISVLPGGRGDLQQGPWRELLPVQP
jgi:UDP-2,3-diacylglucosamine hydrolase